VVWGTYLLQSKSAFVTALRDERLVLKERRVNVDGVETFYLEGERLHGPSVVLLHGWGLSSHAFRSSLEFLNTRFHVVAPDLPSFGRTTAAPSFGEYQHYAHFLAHFLQAIHIDRANLIGQSMGGAICAVTAALFPDQVESLILANSAGIPLSRYEQVALKRGVELASQALASGLSAENLHAATAFARNLVTHRSDLLRSIMMAASSDIRPLLHQIKAPCLLAWGANDVIFPLEFAKEFEDRIPQAELLVIPNGYHEWSLIHPRQLLQIATKFYLKHGLVQKKVA
jgi:pimeloyl-ACP methyl ester carboxylesterase